MSAVDASSVARIIEELERKGSNGQQPKNEINSSSVCPSCLKKLPSEDFVYCPFCGFPLKSQSHKRSPKKDDDF